MEARGAALLCGLSWLLLSAAAAAVHAARIEGPSTVTAASSGCTRYTACKSIDAPFRITTGSNSPPHTAMIHRRNRLLVPNTHKWIKVQQDLSLPLQFGGLMKHMNAALHCTTNDAVSCFTAPILKATFLRPHIKFQGAHYVWGSTTQHAFNYNNRVDRSLTVDGMKQSALNNGNRIGRRNIALCAIYTSLLPQLYNGVNPSHCIAIQHGAIRRNKLSRNSAFPPNSSDGDEGGPNDNDPEEEETEHNEIESSSFDEYTTPPSIDEPDPRISSLTHKTNSGTTNPIGHPNQTDFAFTFSKTKRPSSIYAETSLLNTKRNTYFDSVIKVAPNELIKRFAESSPKRVQDAAKATVLGLLGTLPKFSLETTILTTGEKLASLMFQLQITGYMFKNAEYRLGLSDSLKLVSNINCQDDAISAASKTPMVTHGVEEALNATATTATTTLSPLLTYFQSILYGRSTRSSTQGDASQLLDISDVTSLNVTGKLFAHMGDESRIEIDATRLIAALQKKIKELEAEIESMGTQSRNEERTNDLLSYIRNLPEVQMRSLTENASEDVIDAMKMLTGVVIEGLGGGKDFANEAITQQTGSVIAQLCMWQLAVGYNFRELEVREDMRQSFDNSP